MTFLELYGDALDRELASADRIALFTIVRRKYAVNEAQKEFTRLTDCYVRTATIPVVSGTSEYDIELAATDFWKFSKDPLELHQTTTATGDLVVISGDDLPRRDINWLDKYRPGWRTTSTGTPTAYYVAPEAGANVIGLDVAPDVPATETWALVVPYVAQPIDMSADSDEPWSASSDPLKQLRPWHQALAHFAASSLERFRKDYQASDYQLNRFAAYVSDYLQTTTPHGGLHVGFARNYLRETHRPIGAVIQADPRRYP